MSDWGRLGARPDVVYQDDAVCLICGRWQDVVDDLPTLDAVICDPPYSERTHGKQQHGRRAETTRHGRYVSARGIGYDHFTEEDVRELVSFLLPINRGWWAVHTDHGLAPAYERAYDDQGLTKFAPIPCVLRGMNVRLAGDGPSSWTVWLMPARPRNLHRWGTLPGAYVGVPFDAGENAMTATRRRSVVGGKPVWLIREIVRDYSRPGDLVLDPFAGGGTTGLAARLEGRRALLIERDEETALLAAQRLHPLRGAIGCEGQGELFFGSEEMR